MSWVDLPSVPEQFKRRTGLCAEAARRGLIPSWPNGRFQPVKIPAPPRSQDDAPADAIAKHCAQLYSQAYAWSGRKLDKGDLKSKFHMALSVLSKDSYAIARQMKSALRQLRDGHHPFPLLLWAWWVVQQGYLKDRDGAAPQAVFSHERIMDSKARSYFYRDCGGGLAQMPAIWPAAAQAASDHYREFLTIDAYLENAETAANIWEVWYAAKFQRLADVAERQHSTVNDKVLSKVHAYDLGLWLTTNVPEYLKVEHIAIVNLK